ncbi:DUF397 domain-containing protein [Streptomyces sp. NPDC001840]|uniref:DUF397 domain-containing protein n=1 Tax=Streptomyces sp. NPDC059396 TaxID=3346819 RepID=UPI003677326C
MKSTDVALESAWFKSSYSSGAEGNCVEIADLAGQVSIRDSKDKEGATLTVPSSAFSSFISTVRSDSGFGAIDN